MRATEAANAIRTMKIRGAAEIARTGAEALKDEALAFRGKDLDAFRTKMKEARETILASRPTAVSLWNAVNSVFLNTSGATTVDELRKLMIANSDDFIERSKDAIKVIGRFGAGRLKDGDRILTHCNSKAALAVIIEATREGKKLDVYATESRPWRQGLITVKDLSEAGIEASLIVDSAARWAMKRMDAVVVGADTVCSNGAVVKKIGTSQIALAAH